jgi:ATP-dependent protease HslVU (ClpYQ) peptidase subunit
MTVIAWDGTTIAVDSLVVFDNRKTYSDKLFKNKDEVIAVAGNMDVCMTMLELYKKGITDAGDFIPQNEENESYLVIATREHGVWWMCEGGHPVKVNDQIFAIGSGADLAIAAMHCGKSAVEAVEIACLYDIYCGGKINFHSFIGPVSKKTK